jgi:hypothetical protein
LGKKARKLTALYIRDTRHLCKHLGTQRKELESICKHPERYYWQRQKTVKGKIRNIATPRGRLREILDKLQILLQRASLPNCIHGGRKGLSNITNADVHINKSVVLNLDLKDFFPNLKNQMVYKIFCKRLECSPNVSRYLTRLTTLNGSLPQGSPTSTILAALATEPLAKRLENLAKGHYATYSQYVDDITVSGSEHVQSLIPTIKKIIRQEGFKINNAKTNVSTSDNEQIVTGVRVNKGRDVPKEKLRTVRKQVETISPQIKLLKNYSCTELASIRGKIHNITQLNKGAGRSLTKRLNKIIN